ncbi:hypothetical protein HO944_08040 [Streptococcus suis]|uniref:Uncharacterized protein n=1 Tax=Streptococcus suis TaxID=1307 RepID=A0A0Z8TLS8_STRSU|nr:hypothetical protein [Streptococcus suis]MBY4635121.1 hypothetical protein [Streptococcus suis]MCK4018813.1 hypothetical protein [Streptococcus suis]MCK4076042.1 hypothetical protein [Streptococcus suis]NQO81142.1 hypothetical protein [Streptococcus suis]NQO89492.1 hypothetical protein [Streptococcus suis]
MFGYFKKNWYIILLLVGLIFISGPIFSLFLTYIQQALNSSLGDWLSFYGAIIGIGISFFVFHFQLFIDKEKFKISQRPEMFLDYSYQVVKASSYVYYHDKYWYGLIQSNKNTKKLAVNSFQNSYGVDNKRDKALSIEIVNNQPLFNLQIQFGDPSDYAIIPKLSEGQKIYIVSKKHQEAIFNYLLFNIPDFSHIPSELTIYYTTLSGEKMKRMYRIDEKGQVSMVKEQSIASYSPPSNLNYVCDYFIK